MPTRNLSHWIALSLLPGIGPRSASRALELFGDPETIAYRVPAEQLAYLPGVHRKRAAGIREARKTLRRRAEREITQAAKLGVTPLSREDAGYPAAFAELPDPPAVIYVRGSLSVGVPRVAIVGSRRATLYGRRVADGMAIGLAERGVEVVSGGARGIDEAAHAGALGASGKTIAVLGSGLRNPYPEEHKELFSRIVEGGGALISEFPLDIEPRPENFPRRNRLISGLSAAVVVVEAARRSGSLVTAGHALDQGRELLAVPGPVSSSNSSGTNWLIQQGAKLVQNIEDIVEELSPLFRTSVKLLPRAEATSIEPQALLPDERTLLELLDPVESQQLDELADRAPFGFARLLAALTTLEVVGAVDRHPGRRYTRKLELE